MSKQIEALKLALDWYDSGNENPDDFANMIKQVIALAEQPAQGCDYCNHPQYAGTKCKNCGREQPAQQEPVACPDGRQCKHGAWCTETYCQEHCEFRAPPQRKPLTDEEIWDEVKAADLDWQTGWSLDEDASNRYITFARAIEAAHGITGETQ